MIDSGKMVESLAAFTVDESKVDFLA